MFLNRLACLLILFLPPLALADVSKAHKAYNKGIAEYLDKEYDDAIENYDDAIKEGFKDARVYYNRGLAHFMKSDRKKAPDKSELKKALDDFSKATVDNPKFGQAWYMVGLTKQTLGESGYKKDFDRAKELLRSPSK